jgi:hypothetical protein
MKTCADCANFAIVCDLLFNAACSLGNDTPDGSETEACDDFEGDIMSDIREFFDTDDD